MLKAVLYWIIMLLAALAVGPAAGALVGGLRAPDGAGHVTPLTSTPAALGLGAGIAALLLAIGAAYLSARLLGPRAAMTVAGIVAAWIAVRSAAPDDLIQRTQRPGMVWLLAVEGAILGTLALFGAFAVLRAGGPARGEPRTFADGGLKSIAAGAAAAAPVAAVIAYLVAFESLKLQTVFAASFAGIGAGAAAALACSLVSSERSIVRPTLAAFAGMALLAAVGPASALAVNSGAMLKSAYAGMYFPLAAPLAFDWIAGAFLGIPIGIGWAGAMIDKHPPGPQAGV